MPTTNPSTTLLASGDIRPCRFVKANASADFGCTEADANEVVIGIVDQSTKAFDSSLHASAGLPAHVFIEGAECLLEVGSGGVTAGAFIKSDADGKGVLAATTGTTEQNHGAQALEAGAEGALVRVRVHLASRYPALA